MDGTRTTIEVSKGCGGRSREVELLLRWAVKAALHEMTVQGPAKEKQIELLWSHHLLFT